MPRTPEQNAEIRRDTRHTILEAAFELFSRKGFHASSVSQIAEAAGVSKGLMYNYFGSKNELLKAIVLEFFNEGEEVMMEILQSSMTPFEKLEALMRQSYRIVIEQPEQARLMLGLSVQEEVWDGIRFVLKQKIMGYFQVLSPLLEKLDVSDTRKELIFLTSLLDGYSIHMVTMKDELCETDEMIDYIMAQLKIKYKCDETCEICNSDIDRNDGIESGDPGPGRH